MIDEGYIKFEYVHVESECPSDIDELIAARNTLRKVGLIGVYQPSGIGYGNISQMQGNGQFVISASATGAIEIADNCHFSVVTGFDITANKVWCAGKLPASSESMTHAALYACDSTIKAVIHVHNYKMWQQLLKSHPCTPENVAYGSPEMARAVMDLYKKTDLKQLKLFAMAGHEEGIVAFGKNVGEALEKLKIMPHLC